MVFPYKKNAPKIGAFFQWVVENLYALPKRQSMISCDQRAPAKVRRAL